MYLKSIEVNGFKSFANKILFSFNDGITGIVGPNGSGKSNVADAVRWVLGEQSAKQLRGAKMEDVIFSGTQLRKPQSSAYVAITLDNSDGSLPIDFAEVKVSRRVFRSGESEYAINGSPCRLRDVQELFFDTGIGKEGYSIIGQGQIERILSGKPEDRRELFDEAAGIVKYKKRKKQAEKNLEEERENLSRVTDILREIEHQLAPLEKQSEVAKQFLLYRDNLRTLDINMFIMDYDRIHESTGSVTEKITIADDNLKAANEEYESTKKEYETLEGELEEIDADIDEIKGTINDAKVDSSRLEGEINVINEQITAHKIDSGHYEARIKTVKEDIKEKTTQLEDVKKQLDENDEKLTELDDKKVGYDDEHLEVIGDIAAISDRLDEIADGREKMLHENADIKAALERNSTMLEQNNIRKASLNQKILTQKSSESVAAQNLMGIEKEAATLEESITKLDSKIKEAKTKILDINNNVNKYKNDSKVLNQELLSAKSKLESLKNLTERYDGYGNSIKKVMEQKQHIKGIVGVVADIIKSEKKYETAIETALGGSIQNIVTDNENTAKKLIEFLKVNRFGRATFLPLTTVNSKGGLNNESALNEKGAIGTADTLIIREERFDGLIKSLVGRVLVVDNIDNAIAIARKYKNTLRIVTLEGELLNPGGSMSGGAFRNNSNLLGRRREIEELEEQINKKNTSFEKVNSKLENLRSQREDINVKMDEDIRSLQELRIKKSAIDVNLASARKKLEEVKNYYSDISEQSNEIAAKQKEINTAITQLTTKSDSNDKLLEAEKNEAAELEKKLEKLREKENNVNQLLTQLGMDYSGLEKARQYIAQDYMRLEKEIKNANEELEQITESVDGSDSIINGKLEQIEAKKHQIEDIDKSIKDLEKKLSEAVIAKESVNNKHKSFFSKREELSKRISELDKELFRLNNQKEKLSDQLDTAVSYMWEQYELTYTSSLEFKTENSASYDEMKKEIARLKSDIKALGDVNVNAVEDYKNLSERYDLLKTQHDDLVVSEEALMKIIDDLDEEMKKQFEEKFAQIKTQFDIVFKQLFGGGKGTLELIEDEDILEAGIRIIAQPPGKKLQNMMQLSGGEKSLTAISLLFAIQNLKPSPFCLLDEIEAALDDSNVKRFAQYLHKLTKNTQFIVITHRRGTMTAADRLYGITMQEKGVSTLVSVNLIEGELDK